MNTNEYYDKEELNKKRENPVTSNNMRFTFILILVLIVVFLLFLYFNDNKSGDDIANNVSITLSETNLKLKVGNNTKLLYRVNNYDENIEVNFISGNSNIVQVDNEGNIKAISEGSTKIMAIYFIDNESYKEECLVEVIKNDEIIKDNKKPVINVKFSSGDDNKWTNQSVKLSINTKDESKVDTYYSFNCINNCEYLLVLNNEINVNNIGETIISLKAVDEYNNTEYKTITVKIDKDIPKIELDNHETTIYSNKDYTICSKCTDSSSGCKEEKVCKTYTKSMSNQTLKVYDNVGNYVESDTFNVIIDKTKPKCILDLDQDTNYLTARVIENESGIEYAGFDKNYKDNQDYKIVFKEGTYTFYVKDKAGNTNTCSEDIYKEDGNCTCETGYSNMENRFGKDTPCAKLIGIADYGNFVRTNSYTYETSCVNDLSTTKLAYGYSCEKQTNNNLCGVGSTICYKKVRYERTRTVCKSGTLNNSYCYDLKKATCDNKFFIGRG